MRHINLHAVVYYNYPSIRIILSNRQYNAYSNKTSINNVLGRHSASSNKTNLLAVTIHPLTKAPILYNSHGYLVQHHLA
ncbi:unnamed protein product [Absidia cylindrospora]